MTSETKLDRAREAVSDCMDRILENFVPGSKITVLVRQPDDPEADFMLTNDSLDEAIGLLQRSKERPAT